MTTPLENVLQKISRLRTFQRGGRRAPHKPLLLLIAIAELIRGKEQLPYSEVEKALMPLLSAFAPQVKKRHQPELPYWHLVSDGLWTVEGGVALPRQAGGFPRIAALRKTHGCLDVELATVVTTDPVGTELIIERILEEYFPPTIHEDIMAAVGIERTAERMLRDAPLSKAVLRYRNPRFARMFFAHTSINAQRPASGPRSVVHTSVVRRRTCDGMRTMAPTMSRTGSRSSRPCTSCSTRAPGR